MGIPFKKNAEHFDQNAEPVLRDNWKTNGTKLLLHS